MIDNNKNLKIIMIIVLLIFCLSVIFGCNNNNISKDKIPVTLKLKWLHQSQFAGNYVAKEKGFYENEGLSVSIEEFSFDNPTIDSVLSGEVEFGITGADELLIEKSKGSPLKAIAVIYRINPVSAYALKESGITKPSDFIGKTVGIERASDGTDINIGILYYAMMNKLGINRSEINEVTIGYDASELLAGKTDVSTGYSINEPHFAIEKGEEVNVIMMADYGVNMYADVLFARDDYINENPETVKKIVKATLDGWKYAIENSDEAVGIVLKYAPERTRTHETYMLEKSIPLINTGKLKIGEMTKDDWEDVNKILFEQGLIDKKINVEEVYTNEFIE